MLILLKLLIIIIFTILFVFAIYYFSLIRSINRYVDFESSTFKMLCKELNVDVSIVKYLSNSIELRSYDSALDDCFKDVRIK